MMTYKIRNKLLEGSEYSFYASYPYAHLYKSKHYK